MIDTSEDDIVGQHRLKVPVIRREHFRIRLEEHKWGTFAHCDVYKWNHHVAKEIMETWKTLTYLHGGPIYVYHDCSNRLLEKFILMLGFRFHMKISQTHDIWIWSNNGKSISE